MSKDKKGRIGLPYYTKYDDLNQVQLKEIQHIGAYSPILSYIDPLRINLEELQETEDNKDDIKKLKETLVLSENAKKFLLASHIIQFGNGAMQLGRNVNPFVFVLLYGLLSQTLNRTLSLYKGPFSRRLISYMWLGSFLMFQSLSNSQLGRAYMDEMNDILVCNLGTDYAIGVHAL